MIIVGNNIIEQFKNFNDLECDVSYTYDNNIYKLSKSKRICGPIHTIFKNKRGGKYF